MFNSARMLFRNVVLSCGLSVIAAGCGGAFGVGNTTSPGSTPNIAQQTSYRVVGDIGTPFVATVSDSRSSWVLYGTVPESIVIVNDKPPDRILATKLSNDSRLLGIEIIAGLTVTSLSSTTENYGSVVGAINVGLMGLPAFAPPAAPDVRFFVKGPAVEVFNALVEDESQGNVVQSRAPAVLLYDSPNGGSAGRVDGIFNDVQFFGPFDIDLLINGNLVQNVANGTTVTLKGNTP